MSNFKKKVAAVAVAVAVAAGVTGAMASSVDDGAANGLRAKVYRANGL